MHITNVFKHVYFELYYIETNNITENNSSNTFRVKLLLFIFALDLITIFSVELKEQPLLVFCKFQNILNAKIFSFENKQHQILNNLHHVIFVKF